jgi:S1-C subfamily serine protease
VPEPLGRGLGREGEVAQWGLTVRSITPRMRLEMGLADERGVFVTGVRAGGAAAGKLQHGDIIRSVDGTEVGDLAQFLRVMGEAAERAAPLVRVAFRRGQVTDVTVLRPVAEATR